MFNSLKNIFPQIKRFENSLEKSPWISKKFSPGFGWKRAVFPWFPWLEKVFKIFPDFPDRWEPWIAMETCKLLKLSSNAVVNCAIRLKLTGLGTWSLLYHSAGWFGLLNRVIRIYKLLCRVKRTNAVVYWAIIEDYGATFSVWSHDSQLHHQISPNRTYMGPDRVYEWKTLRRFFLEKNL